MICYKRIFLESTCKHPDFFMPVERKACSNPRLLI